jgi:hypothetical protein
MLLAFAFNRDTFDRDKAMFADAIGRDVPIDDAVSASVLVGKRTDVSPRKGSRAVHGGDFGLHTPHHFG